MPSKQALLTLGTRSPPICTLKSESTCLPLTIRKAVFLAFATRPFEDQVRVLFKITDHGVKASAGGPRRSVIGVGGGSRMEKPILEI